MRLMRIKIFTCASRCAYPHMRIIRMNRMDPQPHGQAYYRNCPTWSERFPVSVVSERTRKLIGAGVETVALADLR